MSGRSVSFVVGAVVAVVIAWWAWPRGRATKTPLDAGAVVAPPPRLTVRKPDVTPAGPGVRFAIVDHRGAPVAGVELTATPAGGATGAPVTATSGDDGLTVLAIEPGRWTLAAAGHRIAGADDLELDGAVDHALPLVVDEADAAAPPEDLGAADRSGGITGIVTGGGARLADLTVALVYDGGVGPGHRVVNARTPHPIAIPPRRFLGAGGAFRWPSLPPGGYDVWISSTSWGTAHTHTTVEPNGWGDATTALVEAASLSGIVQDGRGVAVANVRVIAESDGRILDDATTGDDGVYLLDELPAGTITVRARIAKDVCVPATEILTVVAGKRTTHRIELVCAWQGHAPPP